MRSPELFLILLLPGCMYRVGDLYEIKDVRLTVLENDDERRTHEFDLSLVLAREIAAAGIRVNAKDAPFELVGTIERFREPAIVETGKDVVLVGSVSITLSIRIVDRKTGKAVVEDRRTESASFSSLRLESRETARQQVFDRLARWVVTKFEKDW